MALTVGLITVVGVFLLDLPLGVAVLLGGILAPTDPVLASEVQVEEASDRDRLRFTLTGRIDRVELRRRNFIPTDAFPYQTPVALQYDTGDYNAHLDKAIQIADVAGYTWAFIVPAICYLYIFYYAVKGHEIRK